MYFYNSQLRGFFKVFNLFLLFPNYLLFGKGVVLYFNKLESPSPRGTLCQFWLKLPQRFRGSLSETRRGWKFGLTPLLSLRSKAHKVIREILPYIRSRFAFNWVMPTSLPASIVYIQDCINSPLSQKLLFLPFKYCKPHKYAMSGGHFQCLWKLPWWTWWGFSILLR